MTKNLTFTITGGSCVLHTSWAGRTVKLFPSIYLDQPEIPPTIFQEIINHFIKINLKETTTISFENLYVYYDIIRFNLFGLVRGNLKERLRTPMSYTYVQNGDIHLKWVQPDFLPKFNMESLNVILDEKKKTMRLITLLSRSRKVDTTYYTIPGNPIPKFDIKYRLKTDIDCYLKSSTVAINKPETEGDVIFVLKHIKNLCNEFEINLHVIP